jgi:ATP-dependent protease ClpP protease subunit
MSPDNSPKKSDNEKSSKSKVENPLSPRDERIQLIRAIEDMRNSFVITYVCGDRQGAPNAQIGEDAIRPMYDHIRDLPKSSRIDLFLYSRGGAIEVPWRMITMLREHCNHLSVLIPYRAHSAATLIALGCDEIVMGGKAELGPIDPSLNISKDRGTAVVEQVQVEDVMSFVRFIKEVAGLTDQSAIADNVHILTEKLSPWTLGSIYRTHAHIRMVAQRMLSCRYERVDEQTMTRITETLAEKIYSHGHAICRDEAKDIGLPVTNPPPELESVLWQLFEKYEALLHLKDPIDPQAPVPSAEDEHRMQLILASIESESITSAFSGTLVLRRIRKTPQQVNINLNVGVSLPLNVDPKSVPDDIRTAIQEVLQKIQADAPKWVKEQTQKQSAIERVEARFECGAWRDITEQGT